MKRGSSFHQRGLIGLSRINLAPNTLFELRLHHRGEIPKISHYQLNGFVIKIIKSSEFRDIITACASSLMANFLKVF